MRGRVAEVTAISTPVNGPFSDVRVYYANVEIEDEIEDLRPGLTAEVYFATNFHSGITRVPVQAIKVVEGKSYVALHQPGTARPAENPWRWTPVEVGLSDTDYVEVISGVKRATWSSPTRASCRRPRRRRKKMPANQVSPARSDSPDQRLSCESGWATARINCSIVLSSNGSPP